MAVIVVTPQSSPAQRRPLQTQHISDITTLVMLEDRRDYQEVTLARILKSDHPEVRRRAALSVARINDPRGRALLHAVRSDRDTSVAATAVFGLGQLRDSAAVPLLDSLLSSNRTPTTVAFEAPRALGKIRTPEARAVLAKYLMRVRESASPVVGEALLSIGRQPTRGELAPVLRWTRSANEEVRWRAAWALFRPRDPAAVAELLRLTATDPSGHVRSWAIRGLEAPRVDSAGIGRAAAIGQLLASSNDADRRVRTEAIRTMIGYDDAETLAALNRAKDDTDWWISSSAVEALNRRNSPPAPAAAPAPGGGTPRPPQQRPIDTGKTEADYRRIVETWVVPAYNGAPAPRIEWTTPRGTIELELYPGDAPLATDDFMKVMEGQIIGTAFTRVVPDFVAQQRGIYTDHRLRDEVTRLGLTRGNLSWASAGLDTGRPGYTLGSTPQPHNEGDFTTLGRVVRGIDVVDRLQLNDQVTAVRIIRR